MSRNAFLEPVINRTPGEEFKHVFSRTEHTHFFKGSSIKGRGACLILTAGHFAGIALKPLAYTSLTAIGLFYTIFNPKDVYGLSHRKDHFVKLCNFAATAVVSPFGQIAKTAQAAAGVIHPGAYFKEPSLSRFSLADW